MSGAYGSRIAARFVVASLCLAACAALAPAAPAATNGEIAYVARIDGVTNLLARSGGRVRGILKGDVIADPVWSPEGRRLAMVRTDPVGADLWIAGLDGQGARQVTSTGLAGGPSWSPGGDALAYAEGKRGSRHVYAVLADGTGRRRLTSGTEDEREPAWSSTNRVVYVVHSSTRGDDLYVVPAAGGKPKRLTHYAGNEHSPAWSPGGDSIVFVRAGQLWTIGANGKHARRVTKAPGPHAGPAWSPDGRRIVFATGRPGARRLQAINPSGRRLRALSGRGTDAWAPDWQPTGFDPLIAAAGDIACDPGSQYFNGGLGVPRHCGMWRTSNLLLDADYWNVLPLGDTQYADGTYDKYLQSYEPTWGRTKHLQRPIIGNHEYATGSPAGYFDYFGDAAGPRDAGYYSFDVGAWHVVALNSECRQLPDGCAAGSAQQRWLAADLAAHPARCTLAMWHTPRFSSFRGGNAITADLWRTLEAAGADVVLSGHHHFYERFAPQTADGVASPTGLRQFTVGTGGGSIDDAEGRLATSEKLIETTFGILRLRLRPEGYEWRFVSASADPATDSGSATCR